LDGGVEEGRAPAVALPEPGYDGQQGDEEQQVCDLVVRVFTESVAPLYSPEGVREFLTYAADPDRLRGRLLALPSTVRHRQT
jgi:hypothetical protein